MKGQARQNRECALLLIDVVQGFFSQSGSLYYASSAEIVPKVRALLGTARNANRLVVHAGERHRPDLEDFEFDKIPPHFPDGSADGDSNNLTGARNAVRAVVRRAGTDDVKRVVTPDEFDNA